MGDDFRKKVFGNKFGTADIIFISPELFHFWKRFDPLIKPNNYLITVQIWSHVTRGLFSRNLCQSKSQEQSSVRDEKKSDMK